MVASLFSLTVVPMSPLLSVDVVLAFYCLRLVFIAAELEVFTMPKPSHITKDVVSMVHQEVSGQFDLSTAANARPGSTLNFLTRSISSLRPSASPVIGSRSQAYQEKDASRTSLYEWSCAFFSRYVPRPLRLLITCLLQNKANEATQATSEYIWSSTLASTRRK